MTTFTVQRTNCVENPRAHVNVNGWTDCVRVYDLSAHSPALAFPTGADACFGVPAGLGRTELGRSGVGFGGLTLASDWWPLPDGLSSGDWLYCQVMAYIDNVVAGDAVFWADLSFRNAGHEWLGFVAFGSHFEPPILSPTEFGLCAGVVQIPGEDVTDFCVYMKVDDHAIGGADDATLLFTNVQVEQVYARNAAIPEYADGDSDGWEWTGTAHDSESHETASRSVSYAAVVETEQTMTGDDEFTFFPVDDNYVIEVEFGPLLPRVKSTNLNLNGGTISPDGSTGVTSGDPYTITATPATGYTMGDIIVDGVVVSTGDLTYTIAEVLQHTTIEVTFIVDTVTLDYTARTNGSLVGDVAQSINYGDSGTPVTAVPDAGYHFTHWSDSVLSATRMDSEVGADIDVTASFDVDIGTEIDLVYTAGANGSIVGDADQIVYKGASGTLVTATPSAGYHFVAWSDDAYARAARTDLYVLADVTAEASFAIDVTWNLAYSAGSGGTLTGDVHQAVAAGGNGTLVTAVPNTGYVFTSWSDGVLVPARRELNVGAAVTVSATFTAIPSYVLTYTAGSGGTISGSASQTVETGHSGTLVTAVPSTGYQFVAWSDGKATPSRMDTGVHEALSVSATFALKNLTLAYRAISGGTIVGSTPQTVAYGASGSAVTATPNTHYHFTTWNDGVATAARTDSGVMASKRVYARFELDAFDLHYSAGANGHLYGNADQSVKWGRRGMPVTAIPDVGYHFLQWSDAVAIARRTELVVAANVTVTAQFEVDT